MSVHHYCYVDYLFFPGTQLLKRSPSTCPHFGTWHWILRPSLIHKRDSFSIYLLVSEIIFGVVPRDIED